MFLVHDIPGPFTGTSFGKEIISKKGRLQVYYNGHINDYKNDRLIAFGNCHWLKYLYVKRWLKELKEE